MNRISRCLAAFAVVPFLVGLPAIGTPILNKPVLTAPVPADELRGSLVHIDANALQFILRANNGEEYKFSMDEDAQVYLNDQESQLADLRAGDKVRVIYRQEEDQYLAIEVWCRRDR